MARTWIFGIVCLTLAGCATPRLHSESQFKCTNPNSCAVMIENPTCNVFGHCTASVNIERIIFERAKNNFKVTWTLPAGFGFCDTAGDGVFLKKVDPNEQFEDPRADSPGETGPCRNRQFHLKAKNTKSLPSDPYYYNIFFHDAAGARLYTVDPIMMNE